MTTRRRHAEKKPTQVSMVEERLIAADDFVSMSQLRAATGLSACQVSAALHHLQKYKAAESVAGPDALWWFATPSTDRRTKVLEERTPEDKPRRTRRTRKVLAVHPD